MRIGDQHLVEQLVVQRLIKHLVETGRPGSIVNIISMAANCGQSYLTAYSASKGALATLTKNAANAYAARRIRCKKFGRFGAIDRYKGRHILGATLLEFCVAYDGLAIG